MACLACVPWPCHYHAIWCHCYYRWHRFIVWASNLAWHSNWLNQWYALGAGLSVWLTNETWKCSKKCQLYGMHCYQLCAVNMNDTSNCAVCLEEVCSCKWWDFSWKFFFLSGRWRNGEKKLTYIEWVISRPEYLRGELGQYATTPNTQWFCLLVKYWLMADIKVLVMLYFTVYMYL